MDWSEVIRGPSGLVQGFWTSGPDLVLPVEFLANI